MEINAVSLTRTAAASFVALSSFAGAAFAADKAAFRVGEAIFYSIRYGIVDAGVSTLQVTSTETVSGRTVYHILSKARTNKNMDVIFKVRDQNESWSDVESLCSVRFTQHLKEGHYRKETETLFDQEQHKFHYRVKKRNKPESIVEGEARDCVQDALSSLYYLRNKDLKVGGEYFLDINSGGKNWSMKVAVEALETVQVPAGRFECFRLAPTMQGEGIFRQNGNLTVWMTNDKRRIPVQLRSKVTLGSFAAQMTQYTVGHETGPEIDIGSDDQ